VSRESEIREPVIRIWACALHQGRGSSALTPAGGELPPRLNSACAFDVKAALSTQRGKHGAKVTDF
jgi:hypothetical protein